MFSWNTLISFKAVRKIFHSQPISGNKKANLARPRSRKESEKLKSFFRVTKTPPFHWKSSGRFDFRISDPSFISKFNQRAAGCGYLLPCIGPHNYGKEKVSPLCALGFSCKKVNCTYSCVVRNGLLDAPSISFWVTLFLPFLGTNICTAYLGAMVYYFRCYLQ